MASPDLTTARGLIEVTKKRFFPDLTRLVFREHPTYARIKKAVKGQEMKGDTLILPLHIDNPSATVFSTNITTAMDLPVAGRSVYDQIVLTPRKAMSTVAVPDVVIDRLNKGDNGWVNPWAEEMQNLKDDMGGKIGFFAHGDTTCKLATVVSFENGSPDVVTVDSTRMLNEGGSYDFYRSGSAIANGSAITITRILSATTFSCTMTGTPTAGDIIVPADSYGAGPHGLGTIMDNTDTSYFGVDRTADYSMQVSVVHNNGGSGNAAVNPIKVKELLYLIRSRSGKLPDAVVCPPDIYDALPWVKQPDFRYDPNKKVSVLGPKPNIDGVEIIQDLDSPAHIIRALDWGSLVRGWIGDFIQPHTGPGGEGFIRPSLSSNAGKFTSEWQASFKHYSVIAAKKFQTMGYIDEITGLYEANSGYSASGGYTQA